MKIQSSRLAFMVTSTLALVAGFAPTAANAESQTLVRLVHRLDGYVAEFRKEVTTHFIHSGAYRHLAADANSMIREVAHIDDLVHDGYGALTHIRTDLRELDALAHHVHELFDAVDEGRYGHVHGDTDHVHDLIREISDTIHEMQEVVSDLIAHRGHDHRDGYRGGSRDYREYRDSGRVPRGIRLENYRR